MRSRGQEEQYPTLYSQRLSKGLGAGVFKLCITFSEICLKLLDFVFYDTQLMDTEAALLLEEEALQLEEDPVPISLGEPPGSQGGLRRTTSW